MSSEKKKRGRKPKQFGIEEILKTSNDFVIKEQRILCIPIKYTDIFKMNQSIIPVNNEILDEPRKEYIDKKTLNKKEEYSVNDKISKKNTSTVVHTYKSIPDNSLDPEKFLFNTKTDICCWWCTYPFDTYPVYLPTKFDHKKEIFHVKGIFCSFECSLSYSQKTERNNSPFLVNFLHKRILKSKGIGNIRCAPPKEVLEKFGGPVSIEQFRENNHTIEYILNYFPVKFIPLQIGIKRINDLISKSVKSIDNTNKDISENLQKLHNTQEEPVKKSKSINNFKLKKLKIKENETCDDMKENSLSKFLGLA